MKGDNCDESCNGNGLMVVVILSVMVRTLVNDQRYTMIVVTFLATSLSMRCIFLQPSASPQVSLLPG